MKITLEFEHPCELIDLLEKVAQNYVLPTATTNLALDDLLIKDRIKKHYTTQSNHTCSLSGTEHNLCDAEHCEE